MNLRRVVILALLLFSQLNLFSQANYLVGNCKGSFMDISGSGSLLAGSQADDAALTFALPFPMIFYGTSYSTCELGTNGWMRFAGSSRSGTDLSNVALTPGMNLIAPQWDDLTLVTGSGELNNGIYTQVMGTAPNRVLVIQWLGSYFGSSGNSDQITFEIKYHETTNEIEILLQDLTDAADTQNNGASATVGVAGPTGTTVTQLYFNQVISPIPQARSFKPYTSVPPSNYTASTCGSGFIDIRNPANLIAGTQGDELTANVTLPFKFNFYGQCITSGVVSTNGFLRFSPSSRSGADLSNAALTAGMNLIAPLWDDLNSATSLSEPSNGIYAQTNGVAPNRQYILQWVTSYFGSSNNSDSLLFEIILFEQTNEIRILHQDVTDGTDTQNGGSSATVGIAGPSGTSFVQTSLNTAFSAPTCFSYIIPCATPTDITCPANVGPVQCGTLNPLTTLSGNLISSDPSFIRPANASCILDSINRPYYDVIPLVVLKPGTFTLSLNSGGMDFFALIYNGQFNACNPCSSLVYWDDDTDSTGATPNLDPTITFTASGLKTYYLVTTSYCTGMTGAYTWTISSSGGGKIIDGSFGIANSTATHCYDYCIAYKDAYSITCPGDFTIDRKFLLTDICLGTVVDSCIQSINIDDTIPPVLICPGDMVVSCPGTLPALPATYGEFLAAGGSATDECCLATSTFRLIGVVPNPPTCSQPSIVSYEIKDTCGNADTCMFNIVVNDITPPTARCKDITVNLDPMGMGMFMPSQLDNGSSDDCPGGLIFSMNHSGNVTYADTLAKIPVTLTVMDSCGNSATCISLVCVRKSGFLEAICKNITVYLDAMGMVSFTADDIDGGSTPSSDCGGFDLRLLHSGTMTCDSLGVRMVDLEAFDDCSADTCTAMVTVLDTIKPMITCPATLTVSCASMVPAQDTNSVVATDNCPGVRRSFVSDQISSQTCQNRYTLTRTYMATDRSGNTATCSQTITVNDITVPVLATCPANVTIQCVIDTGIPPIITFTDNCQMGTRNAIFGSRRTVGSCRDSLTLFRTWTARDTCGNVASCTQRITIFDNVRPSMSCPAPVTVTCASSVPPPNTGSVVAADACGNSGIVVVHLKDSAVNMTCPNKFTVYRFYRATDACGNTNSCSQIITVNDNVNPTALCKNITVNLDPSGNASITASQINNGSTDNCSSQANLRLAASPSVFTCANSGPVNVTLSVTDECGNVGTCVAIVTVSDVTPPVFVPSCPAKTITLNAGPGECEVSWDAPPFMAMDNCPAGQFFGSINRVGNICRTNAAWQISGGAGAWGVMFDLVNTSGGQLNLQEVGWFSFANVTHNIYYRTAPGPYAPVQATASAWTLCASRVATHAGFTGPKDTFNLITGTAYDTLKACDPIIVDSTKIGCLTMAAGETRGVYIHAPGQASAYLSIFGDCTTGIFGDANVNTPVNGATYTGGLFTAPFVNSSFGFGNTNWIGHIGYALATSNRVRVIQTCGAPYGPGCYFPIGCTTLCYEARDAAGNLATCTFDVCVNAYANPKRSLSCNDDVQISLDEECYATVGADDVLEGGPYSCYDDYIVEIRNWNTGQLIDRRPTVPGVQVGVQDIGQNYQVKVIDPVTGNSCWGHIRIEDKLAPVLTCPGDLTLDCTASTLPANTGTPTVEENCGGYTLTYQDNVTLGSCALGYDKIIERRWTAIDGSGNKSSCVQTITVNLGDLNNVLAPANYDGLPGNRAMLACDGKIDRNKDVTPHEVAPDTCIDGYLLDSVYWRANPTRPNIYLGPGGTLGRRIPRALGWNCIDDVNDPNYGHPSPDPVYYPAHKNWDALNPNCYGPEVHVMWYGTGRPATACRNFGTTYQDVIIDLAKPGCDAGPIGCYKVLRQWTVMDWCTGKVGGHNQVIKVADVEGPKVLYPDSAVVTMDVWSCTGTWEVPPAWLLDNCSNELHYTVEVEDGVVSGNETDGYIVSVLPRGIQNAYIVAEDCCGNITKKTVRLNVLDNVPPIPVCIRNTVVSLVGGGSAGENITKIFATSFDEGSFDNCSPHIYVKAIRMEELLGTINGRLPPTDNRVSCNGLNGDDDPDPVFAPGNQVYFDDFVKFCCADVGQKIMVVLRVFDVDPGAGPIHPNRMGRSGPNLQFVGDLFGHYSDCMVEVEVQDKVLPTLIPPPNIVVSCWFWYDFEKLRDPLDPTFGRVVTDLSARAKVKTNDLVCQRYCVPNTLHNYPGPSAGAVPPNLPAANIACNYYNSLYNPAHPDNKYELVWGFDGYVTGGCNVSVTVTPNDDNVKCGQGVLTRTFTVRTSTGVTLSRQQTIWIVDCDPFYVNPADYCDPNDDIEWPTCISASLPGRVELDGCGADLSPDNPRLGRPKVMNNADDNCALIAIEYDDEVFTIEPDACLKVIRTWTVIDWCQYDPSRNILTGRWEYQQVIKVRDNDDPVVDCSMSDCEPATKDPVTGICWGHINLTATATDHCTPEDWLFWEYKIDLYNDGKGSHSGYDLKVGSLTHKQFDNGETPRFNHNPYADNQGNPFNASGVYPIGVHRISWYVEDGCGNIGVCEKLFEIKDCKAPTPYCLSGIVTTVMPSTGCITIWAKDFDHGSYDNCTPPANLKIYFEGGSDSLLICCSDFEAKRVNDELILPVKICVEDEEGNKDCCETTMIVQDPNNVCPDDGTLTGTITGELKTENNDVTKPVKVELYNSSGIMMVERIGSPFTFSSLKLASNYTVRPTKVEEPANGVSTADIVKIQKHILGQDVITSPYKLIAADVSNNGKITASDISEIRKLILGVTSKFASVESWTFVPKSYVFADPTQPWGAPRTATEVFGKAKEEKVCDFVAIKMGDLNGNARASNVMSGSVRTSGKLRMEIDEQEMVAGEVYKVNFKSNDFRNISGYQFTLKFDSEMLNFEGVESGVLGTTESNFGTNRVNEGILTTSWNSGTGTSYGSDETLFTVVFRSVRSGKLSGMLAITSEVTAAEAYEASEEVKGVGLNARTEQGVVESGVFELYQNNPNPFNKETVVSYRLPEAGAVKLSIYDVTGKVIRVYEIQGQKGLNTQKIERSELNGGGVLYYQLDATNHTATKRMIMVK